MTQPDLGAGPDPRPESSTPDPRLASSAPDPDPTPTASPWEVYLAAAQSLDAVLREAAAAEAAAAAQAASAWEELSRVRAKLDQQRAQVLGEAVRAGLPAPQLIPTATEQAAADAQVAGSPTAAAQALRHSQQLLAAADAQLVGYPMSPVPPPPVPPPPVPAPPVPAPPVPAPPIPPHPGAPPPVLATHTLALPPPAPPVLAPPALPPPGAPVPVPQVPVPQVPPPLSPVPMSAPPAPVPRPRGYWPPPLWVLIVAPITAASLLLCVVGILLFVTT